MNMCYGEITGPTWRYLTIVEQLLSLFLMQTGYPLPSSF